MRSSAIAACMLVACTGFVRAEGLSLAEGLSPADLARNTTASYSGSGEAGRTLRFPDSPDAFARSDDYRHARPRIDGGALYANFGHMFR